MFSAEEKHSASVHESEQIEENIEQELLDLEQEEEMLEDEEGSSEEEDLP